MKNDDFEFFDRALLAVLPTVIASCRPGPQRYDDPPIQDLIANEACSIAASAVRARRHFREMNEPLPPPAAPIVPPIEAHVEDCPAAEREADGRLSHPYYVRADICDCSPGSPNYRPRREPA